MNAVWPFVQRSLFRRLFLLCACLLFAFVPTVVQAETIVSPTKRDANNVPGSVLTQAVVRSEPISGLGRVIPTAILMLRANLAGQIQNSTLALGQIVSADEIVGYLGGPILNAQIEQAKARLAQETARVKAASREVDIDQKTLKYQLSTRKTLLHAELALGLANADRDSAQSALNTLQQERVLRAPTHGVVTRLEQINGSRVQAGMAIAQIEPIDDLRLRADFYSTQAADVFSQILPGMRGWFTPLGSHRKITVQVDSVLPLDAYDGALPVIFQPVITPNTTLIPGEWQSGVMGTVVLNGTSQTVIPIPTRALILERGQWWVLIRKQGSWQRQAVEIGTSHGETTDVIKGLSSDERVLVDQAYLEFHRDFSLRYQQPD